MEIKKTDKANIEKLRIIFFEIGIVLSLLLIIVIFEVDWNSGIENDFEPIESQHFIVEEQPMISIELPQVSQQAIITKPSKSQSIDIVKTDDQIKEDQALLEKELKELNDAIETLDSEEEDLDSDEIFVIVDQMPQFPGGESRFRIFLANSIQYPDYAKKNKIEGKVVARFVVDENGIVTRVKIIEGANPILDEAVLKGIKTMPNWYPGKRAGKCVKVCVTVPFMFYTDL